MSSPSCVGLMEMFASSPSAAIASTLQRIAIARLLRLLARRPTRPGSPATRRAPRRSACAWRRRRPPACRRPRSARPCCGRYGCEAFGPRMSAARPPRSIRVAAILPPLRERSPAILPAGLRPSGHDRLRGHPRGWRGFALRQVAPSPGPSPAPQGRGDSADGAVRIAASRTGGSPAVRAGGLRSPVAATSVARARSPQFVRKAFIPRA
jgi:hypothetical protein